MQPDTEKQWTDDEVNVEINEARRIEQQQMAEYFSQKAAAPTDNEVLTDETCRAIAEGKLVPQNAIAPPADPAPPRKMSLDELQRLLERDSDVPLQILPNGEIREADTGERTERKPLTMRDNLGGEYAGQSFSVPADAACEYTHESFPRPEPEHILGSPELDKVVEGILADPEKYSLAPNFKLEDPGAPRPRQRAMRYRPYQVLAIASLLAAEHPGMFAGPDILGPVRIPPPPVPPIDFDRYRKAINPPPIVLDSIREPEPPPLEKRPGHRSGYKIASEAHHVNRGGKPSGSKLARKAARGKL